MSKIILKKNGTDYLFGLIPLHYPADRVYLDGDTTKTVQDAIDKQEAMIATVQPNLTAVKAYAKGEQFVYNGLLYKTTASISSGGTITINGNCALADSVTEQIRVLDGGCDRLYGLSGWNTSVSNNRRSYYSAINLNGAITVSFNIIADNISALTANTEYSVTTLPYKAKTETKFYTPKGEWKILKDSNTLTFTPSASLGAYIGDIITGTYLAYA